MLSLHVTSQLQRQGAGTHSLIDIGASGIFRPITNCGLWDAGAALPSLQTPACSRYDVEPGH